MGTADKLQIEFLTKPDYSVARIQLSQDEKVHVEPSAMISMDSSIEMKTHASGSISDRVKLMMAGESFFINEYSASGGSGEILVAPGAPGDLAQYSLSEGQTLFLQSSSYVASTTEVKVDTQWEGLQGFFDGCGLFLLKLTGCGDVIFNSYGAILEIPVQKSYIVDTGYVVAFEGSVQYHTRFLGGLKTTLFGGEGLVCEFTGEGKVWMQTRKIPPFASWLWPFRRKKRKKK